MEVKAFAALLDALGLNWPAQERKKVCLDPNTNFVIANPRGVIRLEITLDIPRQLISLRGYNVEECPAGGTPAPPTTPAATGGIDPPPELLSTGPADLPGPVAASPEGGHECA